MTNYLIAPSILAADFARLGEEVETVLKRVPILCTLMLWIITMCQTSPSAPWFEGAGDYGVTAPIDVHLMVQPVDDLIRMFADAGATYITFHPEASQHVDRSLQLVRDMGCKAGLV